MIENSPRLCLPFLAFWRRKIWASTDVLLCSHLLAKSRIFLHTSYGLKKVGYSSIFVYDCLLLPVLCAMDPTKKWRGEHSSLGRLPCWFDSRWAWHRYPSSTTMSGQDSYTCMPSCVYGAHGSLSVCSLQYLILTWLALLGLCHLNLWVWVGLA